MNWTANVKDNVITLQQDDTAGLPGTAVKWEITSHGKGGREFSSAASRIHIPMNENGDWKIKRTKQNGDGFADTAETTVKIPAEAELPPPPAPKKKTETKKKKKDHE